MKIHYYKKPPTGFDTGDCKYSACGFLAVLNKCNFVTENRSKVACKNCRRTKLFKRK